MHHHFSLLLLASFLKGSADAIWCYESQVTCTSTCNGPEKWYNLSGSDCNGQHQSPINIVTKKTVLDQRLTPFYFMKYQEHFQSTIRNNGHSVQVNLPHGALISGGHLGSTYKALQFHLHWGKDGSPGSEHTLDGEQYPMELHIVHVKQHYNLLTDALKDPSGLAVLGFFYEVSSSDNKHYDPIINALKKIQVSGTNTSISDMSLASLIPSERNLTSYFRYNGSLTTPSCTESVVWTVFEHTIPLSVRQLSEFSNLKFSDEMPMTHNFRRVQPLNSRQVYRSGSDVVLASTAFLAAAALVSVRLSWTS